MGNSEYAFERKECLTNQELEEYFEIEKPLYLKVFGEIKEDFKEKFFTRRKSLFYNPDYFNYKITKDGILCGYISFIIFEDKLYLYDITFANKFK